MNLEFLVLFIVRYHLCLVVLEASSFVQYWLLSYLTVPLINLSFASFQDLPKAKPVQIKLPSDLFGDMMMVLEFLNVFGNLFDIKDEFPNGLSFGKTET